MKFRSSCRSLLLIAPFAIYAGTAASQSTGSLTGVVTDPTGAVVAGAHVKVLSLATGASREIDTDKAGVYVVPSLQPGDYMVQVVATGFSNYTVQKIMLDVDARVTVNAKLAVTSAGETVQVESGAAQIEATSMTVGQVIDRQTVQEIPLNGRHFLDLTVHTSSGPASSTRRVWEPTASTSTSSPIRCSIPPTIT